MPNLQVNGNDIFDIWTLDFNHHFIAVLQAAPMDLAYGCCCHGLFVKLLKQLIWFFADLGKKNFFYFGKRERRHIILQLSQLV